MAHVGFTVLHAYCLPPRSVASGRIQENQVNGLHLPEIVLCFGTHNAGILQTEQREIMSGQPAQLLLSLYIGRLPEKRSYKGEVYPQPPGKICHGKRPSGMRDIIFEQPFHHLSLKTCRCLAGTLFQSQSLGIFQPFYLSPAWHFVAQTLPSLHLPQHVGHINVLSPCQL